MTYQTHDKCIQKLESLHLPENLSGARVLDVGCNEGFFCVEAQRRGATTVVGIDDKQKNIDKATQQSSSIHFICQDWDDPLPAGKFDYILHLSAFHYAKNPQQLLDDMRGALAPNGVLILQIGVDQTSLEFPLDLTAPKKEWVKPQSRPDDCVHPSRRFLEEDLLKDFSFRFVGNSPQQEGDSTPRFVYHCYPDKKPTAIDKDTNIVLIDGISGVGKTTLAYCFEDTHILSLDSLTMLFLETRMSVRTEMLGGSDAQLCERISLAYRSKGFCQDDFIDTMFQFLDNPRQVIDRPFRRFPDTPASVMVIEGYFINTCQNLADEFLKRGYTNIHSIHMQKNGNRHEALIGNNTYDVTMPKLVNSKIPLKWEKK